MAATNYFYDYLVNKIVKNTHYNFQDLKVTSSDCLVWPTNSPKPKDSPFIIIN